MFTDILIVAVFATLLTSNAADADCTVCPVFPDLLGTPSDNCSCSTDTYFDNDTLTCVQYQDCSSFRTVGRQLQLPNRTDILTMFFNATNTLLESEDYEESLNKIRSSMSGSLLNIMVVDSPFAEALKNIENASDFEWLREEFEKTIGSVEAGNAGDLEVLNDALNNRRLFSQCGANRRCRLVNLLKRNKRNMIKFVSKLVNDMAEQMLPVFSTLEERATSEQCTDEGCPTIDYLIGRKNTILRAVNGIQVLKEVIATTIVDLFISSNKEQINQ